MNLGQWLANNILEQETSTIKKVVAIYPGRFQPMGAHHAKTYKWLERQFDEAWVALA